MRISDWSSDVCSSDLALSLAQRLQFGANLPAHIGGETRAARIIAFGGAVYRDRTGLRGILGGVGQAIAPGEIADARRQQRGEPREGAVGADTGTRPPIGRAHV